MLGTARPRWKPPIPSEPVSAQARREGRNWSAVPTSRTDSKESLHQPTAQSQPSQLGLETTRRVTTIFGGSRPAQGAPSAPLQPPPPKPQRRTQGLELPSRATSKLPWESENLLRRQRAAESPFILSLVWKIGNGPDQFPRLRASRQGYKVNSREGLDYLQFKSLQENSIFPLEGRIPKVPSFCGSG